MAELKQKKVDVTDLKLGMFVSALDRPWSQTSFPLQGFALRSHREIMAIRSLCQYVYIDVAKSKNVPVADLDTKGMDNKAGDYRQSQVPLKLDHDRYQARSNTPSSKDVSKAQKTFEQTALNLKSIQKQIREGAKVDEKEINQTAGLMVRSAMENPVAITWIALLQRNDEDTYGQSLRSATWAVICGRHMGLEEQEIKRLAAGVMLKDIYRTEADETLPETMAIEKTVNKLREADVHPKIIAVVKYHREKFNGTGKPFGAAGEKIPLLARIAAIATAYDEKIYPIDGTPAIAPSAATKYIYEQRGRAFQEELAVEFIECTGLYPLGTLVKLNTGETACVVKSNPQRRLRPEVMVLRNAEGARLESPARANLADDNGKKRKIESDLPSDPEIDTNWIYESFLGRQSSSSEGGAKKGRLSRLFA